MNPPRCSLASMNGPSVRSASPSRVRTTVAADGACRPPANTHTPASRISVFRRSSSAITGASSASDGVSSGW